MNSVISILFVALAGFAAEGVGSHGGNLVVCGGAKANPITLDYYNARLPTLSGPSNVIEVDRMNFPEIIDHIQSRLAGSGVGYDFESALSALGKMHDWPLADIKDIEDSNEPYYLPKKCKRYTGALRQGEQVYLDQELVPKMSEPQRALLYAHELLYWVTGGNSSGPVREAMRVLLSSKMSDDQYISMVRLLSQGKPKLSDLFQQGYWSSPGYADQRIQYFYLRDGDPQNFTITLDRCGQEKCFVSLKCAPDMRVCEGPITLDANVNRKIRIHLLDPKKIELSWFNIDQDHPYEKLSYERKL